MQRLVRDLRYGARMLAKTPTATVTVLLALALGIALPTMLFSVIDGAMLAPLPVPAGDRVVRVYRADETAVTDREFAAWTARQRSFARLGVVTMGTVTLATTGQLGEPVAGAALTPSVLPLLGAAPTVGRRFTDADAAPGAPAVVLVSDEVWRERLDGAPDVVGRVLRVNGRPAEVIGVMPAGFGFPWNHAVWTPLSLDPLRAGERAAEPDSRWVVGRLRDGVSPADAGRELTALTRALDAGPAVPPRVEVVGYTNLFNGRGRAIAMGLFLLGVASLVLLVACANVANVLLARTVARRREVAVRVAMGASGARIAAQLWAEVALLAAAGAGGGAVIAALGVGAVERALPRAAMPYWVHFGMDPRVLAFVVVAGVAATLLAGVVPAVQAARANTHDLLKAGGRGGAGFHLGRVMRRLVGVEMALSFVLLVMAGLFLRSAAHLRGADVPFATADVFTARVAAPAAAATDPAAQARFADALRQTLAALPPVRGVALATAVPGVGSSAMGRLDVEGAAAPLPAAADRPRVRSIAVTPGFLPLFRARLLAGRDLDDRDRAGAVPVAVVNEAFARRYLPDGALGRRIRLDDAGAEGEAWLTVVGVTSDLLAGGRAGEVAEAVYQPLAQHPRATVTVLARPAAGYAAVPGAVRRAVATLSPDAALFHVERLDAALAQDVAQYGWFSALFLVSGAIALFLAALGLYGVMAFWVAQRTRELGVRMALGGRRGDVVRVVLAQGMTQTLLGLGAGALLALPAAQGLRAALHGVAPYDPLVYGGVAAVLLGAAGLGCWLPARRATRLDPLHALAAE